MSEKGILMKKDKEISRTEKLAQKTDNFLSSNRKLLISILVVILLILAGVGIGITVHSSNVDKKYEELYNLENSYNNLLVIDESTDEYATALSDLESDVDAFLKNNKIDTFLGARATMLLAEVRFLEENWAEAYELSLAIAEAHDDDYFGPLCYINAAAAAENNNDASEALRLYTLVWDTYGVTCPLAPQALFNQARLENANGNTEVARSIFEQLTSEFPSSSYSAIAQSWLLTF